MSEMGSVLEAVARLVDENERLRHRVLVLDAKLIELSDDTEDRDTIRRAYRRGYCTGYHAGRRGAPQVTNPERHARGWVARALEGHAA